MADVTIETATFYTLHNVAQRGGPFWVSPTVGYVIYVDFDIDLKYRKTVDGGANWGGAVNIRTGSIWSYDCWADWQTAGDAGTKIHIAYIDTTSGDIRYVYLDTSGDSVGGDDLIEVCQGTGTFGFSIYREDHYISITKTRGGNLAVALRYQDSEAAYFYSFYTSPDATTWTSEASPWEAAHDFILLFPGNEADNQDVWAVFWDTSTKEISLKTYDDSGDSWSEQLISGSMYDSSFCLQMDGTIRLSDGHLIFAAWSEFDDAAADLLVWDINGAGSITAKTNVLSNSAESFLVSVFINQVNDDIYVAYMKGTAVNSEVAAFYQKSVDGGVNWGGETALQANAEDDERWISAGAMKAVWGGKFQPYWFNDDLADLFTNTDNGISIAAIVAPTVTTQAASSVEATTAIGNGNIIDIGGENCDIRGIVWDLASHGDPGNVAPGASGYANDRAATDSFGTGPFTRSLIGLPTGDTIYCRAYAHNSAGYDYGGEVSFLTKPAAPTSVQATDGVHTDKVVVTWVKSTGATGYKVYEGVNLLDTLGDVATYDDLAAPAPTVTPGAASASDGTSVDHVTLSLAGESANVGASRTYKVVAFNATDDSVDSATDTGYRGVGALTYQWQRSAADSDAAYGPLAGATTDPYNDTTAPINGDGRWYYCEVSATGATTQDSTHDRGYRAAPPGLENKSANMGSKMVAAGLI